MYENIDEKDCEVLAEKSGFKIDSFDSIKEIVNRQRCRKCERRRMYFCYDCRIFLEQVEKIAPQIEVIVVSIFLFLAASSNRSN